MSKMAKEIIEMMKDWKDQIKEKNDIIDGLEDELREEIDANYNLKYELNEVKRKLKTVSEIMAISMKHDEESGINYFGSIWENIDRMQFSTLIKILDIPMTAASIKESEETTNYEN